MLSSKVQDMSAGWNGVDTDTTTGVNKGEEAFNSYTFHWNFGVCNAPIVITLKQEIHGKNYTNDYSNLSSGYVWYGSIVDDHYHWENPFFVESIS